MLNNSILPALSSELNTGVRALGRRGGGKACVEERCKTVKERLHEGREGGRKGREGGREGREGGKVSVYVMNVFAFLCFVGFFYQFCCCCCYYY